MDKDVIDSVEGVEVTMKRNFPEQIFLHVM